MESYKDFLKRSLAYIEYKEMREDVIDNVFSQIIYLIDENFKRGMPMEYLYRDIKSLRDSYQKEL